MQKYINLIGCVGFALACTNTVVGLVFFKSLPATLSSMKSQMLEKVAEANAALEARLTEQATPTTGTGVPW